MNDKTPTSETAPAATFTFSFGVPEPPVMTGAVPPPASHTGMLPFKVVRPLLSGKPLLRPNQRRKEQSPKE